ncbi:G-D-S-L family lipolytic protein [Cellulophaga lytica]|uniref:G-D-S-L family lipolytic protein n=1 Tax=Cellulophaga geojensis KL-A TaxID=1328323 RepID=A0ABN0RK25_9FLAO|nr:GDSL-type esterase/lipase family protein [Cellulophaga geojensis]EWH10679.1 G-D-S-L family lipolytic protein [Cellulophaga geojensis KL-A]
MRILLSLFLLTSIFGFSQTTHRFYNEVQTLQKKYNNKRNSKQPSIVFTGSSSIKYWKTIQEDFPDKNIINTGFGGSTTEDLLLFTDDLILAYNPKQVFIYEGDNDIAGNRKCGLILSQLTQIINKIKSANTTTQIVLISVKPSIARWHLKRNYKKLNRKYKRIAKKDPNISYVDIWKPMLNGNKVKTDIFTADNLHMNAKGYQIWQNVITNYIN